MLIIKYLIVLLILLIINRPVVAKQKVTALQWSSGEAKPKNCRMSERINPDYSRNFGIP